jgi:hypothetical protein
MKIFSYLLPSRNDVGPGQADLSATVILVLFSVLYLTIWLIVVPDIRITLDGVEYYRISQTIAEQGWPSRLNAPTDLEARVQPLYSYLVGILHIIGLEQGNGSGVALLQGGMLLASGLLMRRLLQSNFPRAKNIAFALVVLNPSGLFFAQSLLLDTLFSLLFTAGFFLLVRYSEHPNTKTAIFIGSVLGLCVLTRQEMNFLIWVLPVILVLLAAAGGYGYSWRKAAAHGLMAMIVAFILGLPWAITLYKNGYGFGFTSGEGAEAHFREVVATLEQYKVQNITLNEARQTPVQAKMDYIRAQGEDWQSIPRAAKGKEIAALYVRLAMSYDPLVMIRAFSNYTIGYFTSGGAQHAVRLLGRERLWGDTFFHSKDALGFLKNVLQNADPVSIFITVIFVAFAVICRILGLIGIGILVVNRNWGLLTACIGGISFSLFTHFFIGIARYRLPVDPILLLLASIALATIALKLRNRRSPSENPLPAAD